MPDKIGDLTLEVVLKIVDAQNNAKQFNATLKGTDDIVKKVQGSTENFSSKAARLGFVLNAVRDAGDILASTISGLFKTIQASNEAYQNYLSAQRQLAATSKLTGANLDTLNKISEATKDEFSLSAIQSNLFTIELTKLGQKAGDVSKVQDSIRALMDLGAGQGLSAEETLYAIKQAILGIDEGTDKLFQKNPSVIYEEFAKKIGTTAGKLTDQQKAQALLNAVLESGGKLTGQYKDYLNTAAGKQQDLNNKLNDAKIKFGQQLQPVLLTLLDTFGGLLKVFGSLSPTTQSLVIIFGSLGVALVKLAPLIISFRNEFGGIWKSITSLARDAPGAFKKFEGSALATFGKGGAIAVAIIATIGLIDEILDKIDEANREKYKLKTSVTPPPEIPPGYKFEDGVLKPDNTPPMMNWDIYKKNQIKTQEEQKKHNEELDKTKKLEDDINKTISLGNNHLRRQSEEIKVEEKSITTINDLLKEIFINQKDRSYSDLAMSTNELKDRLLIKGVGRVKESYGPSSKDVLADTAKAPIKSIENTVERSLSFGQQLANILGIGADTFAGKFLGALQEGLSLANSFAQLLSLILGGGGGGIFSLLGLASGGAVPGTGSGDTVPAMLTPGEFVVRKSVVQRLGSGFFEWLNGGSLLGSLTGRFANGGLVSGGPGVQVVVLETRLKGNDIALSQARTNKTNSRRKL